MAKAIEVRFFNSLSKKVEPFEPIEPGRVSMYNCGPTVYDFAHIGNFRAFLFADLIRRFLELLGYKVDQVMNITDVGHMTDDALADGGGEDKMQAAARRLREDKKSGRLPPGADSVSDPDDPYQIAGFYTRAFLEDGRALGLRIAHEYADDPEKTRMPRATDHIPHMLKMIGRLIEKGHAYQASDGAVYFAVESFPEYGKLSGNTLEQVRGGAGGRISDEHQAAKKHPADFLLWKPDAHHLMKWDSPYGAGYPGWHIECSAMAAARLGREEIDIHTGGEDNIFPHHECEIAQTCSATGRPNFARFWMHTRYLLVEGAKMSKRSGNFFTVRDLTEGRATGRTVHPAILRLALIRSHYRSNMDFTFRGLQDTALAVAELRRAAESWMETVAASGKPEPEVDLDHPVLNRFASMLADDLNIAGAFGAVFEWLRRPKGKPAECLAVLRKIDSVLGVVFPDDGGMPEPLAEGPLSQDELNATLDKIADARKAKDYSVADQLKDELRSHGYEVMDTPSGTRASFVPVVVDS